ncbi:MAG: FHA domain-containing protein [Anaerolineae bacterium]|nr:FHA domain-containing protein [Anaerolineae bacterium]
MTLDVFLFILRVVAGLLLLAFIGAMFWLMWRDYRAVSDEVATRTRRQGRLVVTRANNAQYKQGTAFPLLPMTSIGRAPTNTIVLDDSFASVDHATLTLRGGKWWLEDRNSSNGTLLNGYRIEEPVVLSTGDLIVIGQVELKLELE